MPTPKKWRPEVHRKKLLRQFEQLQTIVQTQLNRIEKDPEALTASMLDTCIKGVKNLAGLLSRSLNDWPRTPRGRPGQSSTERKLVKTYQLQRLGPLQPRRHTAPIQLFPTCRRSQWNLSSPLPTRRDVRRSGPWPNTTPTRKPASESRQSTSSTCAISARNNTG